MKVSFFIMRSMINLGGFVVSFDVKEMIEQFFKFYLLFKML